ncbi:cation:proton antiporter [Proteinivorax hydrogeniformans]|uniref:Cation:proton antiporter n=1 Tax=Proteinivorax hydrogeniformans TaxID=1826727 RepID=A0AAU8HSW9_9FIRM
MSISLAVGIIFLAGAAGGKLARYIRLPSVTGNLLAGIIIGPSVLSLVSVEIMSQLNPINDLALGVIALSIGSELHWGTMRKLAKDTTLVFLAEALLTSVIVFFSLYLFGLDFQLALVLAVISIATAPGAIIACIRETPTKGNFSKVLLSIVALDNLLAITLFGIVISFMQTGLADDPGNSVAFIMAAKELGLSLALGLMSGVFLVGISHHAKSDSHILVTVLGIILLTVGLANRLGSPELLAAIVSGAVYINFSRKPKRISRSLLAVEHPILLIFLTLAGAKLDLSVLPAVGQIGLLYVLARFFAKLVGSRLGSTLTAFPMSWKKNLGRALTPQAGVAIGLAIIAEQKGIFEPNTVMPIVLTAVVVFELFGPLLVRKALCDVNE